jgi:hypothetical protein
MAAQRPRNNRNGTNGYRQSYTLARLRASAMEPGGQHFFGNPDVVLAPN